MRCRRVEKCQFKLLEQLWKQNPAATVEDLQKPNPEKVSETPHVQLRYENKRLGVSGLLKSGVRTNSASVPSPNLRAGAALRGSQLPPNPGQDRSLFQTRTSLYNVVVQAGQLAVVEAEVRPSCRRRARSPRAGHRL